MYIGQRDLCMLCEKSSKIKPNPSFLKFNDITFSAKKCPDFRTIGSFHRIAQR
jgi:hypothetical protein